MQGLRDFVPTETKIKFIDQLLKVGFDTIDFGSFVSPKAVPQMADTAAVLKAIAPSASKLLVIAANERGAETALTHSRIDYVGFPMSVSETFQRRNTNQSIERGLDVLSRIHNIATGGGKNTVAYLSMAFGNPYGDPISPEYVAEMAVRVAAMGIKIISLADTVAAADPALIGVTYKAVLEAAARHGFNDIEWGVHLHTKPSEAQGKIKAAYDAGCRRFDVAVGGMGGCPFAKPGREMTGNMPTEAIAAFIKGTLDVPLSSIGIDEAALIDAVALQKETFAASAAAKM